MKITKEDYLDALPKVNEDPEAFTLIKMLIHMHFAMINHMKETSLYDVYMYEERIEKNKIEPLRMLAYENEKLKKEINKLRRQSGLGDKYREMT